MYNVTSQFNSYLNVFYGKYSDINCSEDNLYGLYYNIDFKRNYTEIIRPRYSEFNWEKDKKPLQRKVSNGKIVVWG